ncbi:wax ester/triacylglycerol synthase family O-acyltransferase [Conexibacter sp. W3-3-2]|uniref:WS/DGAT/MGAT family O-acyltransferase n=1 Tax=Conexibacter sp. W3-3-2 TaxID=2675227 RepID=UPI0012B8D65B|nr:wax ester/triacylglycerol synthase family O-acyltransferase [Conexibacter sp. W3-3-2]MTD43750.1 wax ester/triacylglycerol synthase family O-acyltransferase [Conexibacter sp. W3-3-2]
MALRQVSPLDAAWLMLESRDTPMHVAGLFEFSLPQDAPADYLANEVAAMRAARSIPPPWNLRLFDGPIVGTRLPLMQDDRDLDAEYHVRHSALPHPGGQRELGALVSRLHSHPLDLRRPLWEVHVIEGLEHDRFALYMKMHHSIIDGVSGMRMIMRAFSPDPTETEMAPFWTVPAGTRRRRESTTSALGRLTDRARSSATGVTGLGRAGLALARASIGGQDLQAPYRTVGSVLDGRLAGQRRLATQQYDLARVKALASTADCSLNDIVLYLCGTALRRYLSEHSQLPPRSLTAGIPVSLRDASDESLGGTAIAIMVATLGTNIADPGARLAAICASTTEAKRHLKNLPAPARPYYTLLVNGPWITGLLAGLGGSAPVPFNVAISNVPGPPETLYFNRARLEAVHPMSLLLHGNALNITCVSYAGTLNFGFTGARDSLPHLQRLAVYTGQALEELEAVISPSTRTSRRARSSA